jgi:inosose dehydratase
MGSARLGCQTYAWQMSGATYLGRLDHIIEVVGGSGYQGIEAEVQFLGALRDPARMREVLSRSNIALASACIVEDWRGDKESSEERNSADWIINYLSENFPGAILNVCPMPGTDRRDLEERQSNQLACMNSLARRAADRGVLAAYHPNSPAGSVCRTADDYERMLNGLDDTVLKWVPDVGHIAKGGMTPLELMRKFRGLIAHVHFKDMANDGTWKRMGEGSIDFEAVTRFLIETDFDGWLVVEDESAEAENEPDSVTKTDADYLRNRIAPIVDQSARNTTSKVSSLSGGAR